MESPKSCLRTAIRAMLRADEETDRINEAMLEITRDVPAKSVLDVGCGGGAWVLELSHRLGIPRQAVYGIEVEPRCVATARKEFKVFDLDLETQRWPFEDQSLDLVVVNQVLEHLKNAYFCLSEAERVLKVGGHLAIGIPNLSALINRLYLLFGRQPMCIEIPGPHVRSFAQKSFIQFLGSNPAFELKRVLGSSLYPLPWPLVETAARWLPQFSAYSFYLLKKSSHRDACVWLESISAIRASNFTRE